FRVHQASPMLLNDLPSHPLSVCHQWSAHYSQFPSSWYPPLAAGVSSSALGMSSASELHHRQGYRSQTHAGAEKAESSSSAGLIFWEAGLRVQSGGTGSGLG
ncbi:hypothetical protein KUCAC02_010103, partial [Chaenocephalus aceratus]